MQQRENNFDDVETLREKLVKLSERNLIQRSKKHLMDKRRCTERVLRKIMTEYEEKRSKTAKAEMAYALVMSLPGLIEWSGIIWFKDGSEKFSASLVSDTNTMECITELMPVVENGDQYMKYICTGMFVGSLCKNQVRFGSKPDDDDDDKEGYDTVDKKWESQTQNQSNQSKEKTETIRRCSGLD